MRLPALFVAAALGASACSSPAPAPSQAPAATAAPASKPAAPPADRKYLLERVDDAAVVQLYADGFSSLPLKQKTLIWHLYQAALAGRDIFIDQKHQDALEMREVIEQIVAHPQGVDAATLAEVQRYAKLFWLNNGPYNNLTARKFVLNMHAGRAQGRGRRPRRRAARHSRPASETHRPEAGAPAADVLRSERRSDRHQQDSRRRQGHPAGERQQPLLGRLDGGSEGLQREVRPQLAAGEAERQAGRRGLPRRRPLREADHRDRQAPRGGEAVRRADRWPRRSTR